MQLKIKNSRHDKSDEKAWSVVEKKLSMFISTLKDACLFVPTRVMETSILSIESYLHGMLHGN